MRVFLVCLLTCTVTMVVGVLILSMVYISNSQPRAEPGPQMTVPIPQRAVDPKFQFLNHLPNSKVFEFPGGAIQWAPYRNNIKNYLGVEEEAFGSCLNSQRSQLTLETLRIKSNGLRAPHWHVNANEHGSLSQGTAWVGVAHDSHVVATYSVTAGQVIFFPKNALHWVKNVGNADCFSLLFFSTHDETQTLDVFFSTPKDIASRSLKPEGGINFIRTFHKQKGDQAVNLPPNLEELVMSASYAQSPDSLVWRYFYDLKGPSGHYHMPESNSDSEFQIQRADCRQLFYIRGWSDSNTQSILSVPLSVGYDLQNGGALRMGLESSLSLTQPSEGLLGNSFRQTTPWEQPPRGSSAHGPK